MAWLRSSLPTDCVPTRQRCGNPVVCTGATWADGRITGLKILTCHSDDESGRCCDFVARRRYKNSSRSTPRFTIISTRNAISSIVKLARSAARLRLPPEVGHFRPSCAKRKRVAIGLTAPSNLDQIGFSTQSDWPTGRNDQPATPESASSPSSQSLLLSD